MGRPPITTVRGYDLAEVVSALQKACRRGEEEKAVFWVCEMDMSGYGNYAWTRMKVILSEDIGPAEPNLPATFRALFENWQELRKKNNMTDHLPLVHAALLLARARKSTVVIDGAVWGYDAVNFETLPEMGDEVFDKHTGKGRRMGRGHLHFLEHGGRLENEDLSLRNERMRKGNEQMSYWWDHPEEKPRTAVRTRTVTQRTPSQMDRMAQKAEEDIESPEPTQVGLL